MIYQNTVDVLLAHMIKKNIYAHDVISTYKKKLKQQEISKCKYGGEKYLEITEMQVGCVNNKYYTIHDENSMAILSSIRTELLGKN